MKFKSIYSKSGNFFIVRKKYTFENGIFETKDEEVIKFLKNNNNFKVLGKKEEPRKEIKKEAKEEPKKEEIKDKKKKK